MSELVLQYLITITTCICFFVFIYAGRTNLLGKLSWYFVVGIITVLAVVASELVEDIYSNLAYPTWQRYLFSILGYMLRPAMAYVLLLVPLRGRGIKICLYAAIPLAINALFLAISPATHLVFFFDDGNHYNSGVLKFIPILVSGIYLVMFLIFSYIRSKKKHNLEVVTTIPIVLMCCVAVYLESEHDLLGSLPQASIVGMMIYYMYFCIDAYNVDTLTGTARRNKFHHDADLNGAKYFILFDVNGLKRINDDMGHSAGDNALKSFGTSLLHACPLKACVYRIGGDEFGVLYFGATETDVVDLLLKVRASVNSEDLPYGYSCGYARYDKGTEFNDAYKEADDMMYAQKNDFWVEFRRNAEENKANATGQKGVTTI